MPVEPYSSEAPPAPPPERGDSDRQAAAGWLTGGDAAPSREAGPPPSPSMTYRRPNRAMDTVSRPSPSVSATTGSPPLGMAYTKEIGSRPLRTASRPSSDRYTPGGSTASPTQSPINGT